MKNSLLAIFFLFLISFGAHGQTCTLDASISQSAPSLCSGYSVTLTVNPTGGTQPYSYAWTTGQTSQTITIDKAGTYSVTVTDKTKGCLGVTKSVTIAAVTTPNAPTAAGTTVCVNTRAQLSATAPTAPNNAFQWYGSASGNDFLASGRDFQTPPITATTVYYVQVTIGGCTSPRTSVVVNLTAKPLAQPVSICQGDMATLTATGGAAGYRWYNVATDGTSISSDNPYTTPVLTSSKTYYVSSITASGCESQRTPVVVTVTPNPQAPTATTNSPICSGSVGNLHAVGNEQIFNWYSSPSGGVPIISSPDFTTPALTATTTYYVSSQVNTCESARTKVTVVVNPLPAAPATQTPSTCYQTSTSITAGPVGPAGPTYEWYSTPGGAIIFTGQTFPTPALANSTTYYVRANNGGCVSALTPINVTVTPQIPPPVAAGAIACNNGSVTLMASSSGGGTFQWYTVPTGGTAIGGNASFPTPPLKTATTYYVQNTQSGCVSPRTAVNVTVLPAVAPPTVANQSVCSGSTASIPASGSPGGYAWYDSPTGGNLLWTKQVFVTPPLTATTSYYVEAEQNGCPSPRKAVTVTVNPSPADPIVNNPTVCKGSTATLTVTNEPPTTTIKWYDAPTGGNLIFTGKTYKTPALKVNTTYYIQASSGTCMSALVPVTVTINDTPEFQYSSGSYCTSSSNPSPTINDPSGGTFTASPAGLVFVSTSTGEINIGATTPGKYVISFSGAGACTVPASVNINITSVADATFSYNTPFCQGDADPFPIYPITGSGGVFTSTPAGLVFISKTTGEIDLNNSTPGNYTVTNTIAASGTCSESDHSFNVIIAAKAVVNAGPNEMVPAGTPVQLNGTFPGSVSTGTWTGGTGGFNNNKLPNAIYTPGPGETSAKLTLTSDAPPSPCGAVSATVTITFSAVPAAPIVQNVPDCSGSAATLSVNAQPNSAYTWYDAPTGGNLLMTGPNYTTLALTAPATYYVQTTVNGLTSARSAATVTINPIPAAPLVTAPPICAGTKTTLNATGSTGSYSWYDAPTGGNLLWTTANYPTPVLTVNTSYYVESVVNGCISPRTEVDVIVTPTPTITSAASGSVCGGQPLGYTIVADIAGATFVWKRAAVAGISNPSVTNQTSATINETLINTTASPVTVTYVITASNGSCPGNPFNYTVIVNPGPVVTSPGTATICDMTSANYPITFSSPVNSFSWSRAAVAGISNLAVSGQTASTIKEVLFNTTDQKVDVTYIINYNTATCTGVPFSFVVTVNPQAMVTSAATGPACSGTPQNYVITGSIPGSTFVWSRDVTPNISNPAVTNQTSDIITEALVNTSFSTVAVVYNITPTANGCPGTPFKYTTSVNPKLATPVATSNSPVCVGTSIHLSIAPQPNATYMWVGPNGYSSTAQNPVINNVTAAEAGDYTVVFINKGCSSQPATVTVVVDEPAVVDAGPDQPAVCISASAISLAGSVTVSGAPSTGLWQLGPGATGTFSPAANVLNAKYIPSAADKAAGSVKLVLISTSQDNCDIQSDDMTITFSNEVITSSPTGTACSGVAQNYAITSNVQATGFVWSRAAVAGISNPAVSNQNTATITEALSNTTTSPIQVIYLITPYVNNCPGTPFNYTVTVNNNLVAPVATSNPQVCLGSSISLTTPTVTGATYAWTGPNGFTSAQQNPVINNVTNAAAGTYSVVYTTNTCQSPPGPVTVAVDMPTTADAGVSQPVCIATTSIPLMGTIAGSPGTGMWSIVSGTGTIVNPSDLNTQYQPSAADKAAGSVTLKLSTTGNPCTPGTSDVTFTFSTQPAVNAGPDQSVCSQTTAVQILGQVTIGGGATWTTSGSGMFVPNAQTNDPTYVPSATDIKNGSVILTFSANNPGVCFTPSDALTITFIPPPTVNAGGTRYVLKGSTITLNPTVSDPTVTYLWTPNLDLNDNTLKNPTVTGDVTRTYTLTVTDVRGCMSQDTARVNVSPIIVIKNTFTPNGDGINDYWQIDGLIAYTDATVDIFDRYGAKIYHSLGYSTPWDGMYNGKQAPNGVYYYVINTHFQDQVLSGWVTVIR